MTLELTAANIGEYNDTPMTDLQYEAVASYFSSFGIEFARKFNCEVWDIWEDEADHLVDIIIKGIQKDNKENGGVRSYITQETKYLEFNYTPKELEEIINNSDIISHNEYR